MSRSYFEELAVLPDVYSASRESSHEGRHAVLGPGHSSPLLAVGSGGSGTVARYVVDMHRAATGAVTRALTPLEVLSGPPPPPGTRVVFISAGGSNTDVLAAWKTVAAWEHTERIVMCGDTDSPLAGAARGEAARGENVDVVVFDRFGEESFVACASVLAPAVIAAGALDVELPPSYAELVAPVENDLGALGDLWERDAVVALHGSDTAAAAAGLESNFTEAGIGPVMVSDLRNFAHAATCGSSARHRARPC